MWRSLKPENDRNIDLCRIEEEAYLAAHFSRESIDIFSTTEPLSDWPELRLLYRRWIIPVYTLATKRFDNIEMKTKLQIPEKIIANKEVDLLGYPAIFVCLKEKTTDLITWKSVKIKILERTYDIDSEMYCGLVE